MDECGVYSGLDARCVQPAGHDGTHRSASGVTWTDEDTERHRLYMIQQARRWRRD